MHNVEPSKRKTFDCPPTHARQRLYFLNLLSPTLICFWPLNYFLNTWSLFGSVIAVAFQITFRAKMHANDVFLFFKNDF
jgi:hypothetical protein